MKKIILTTLGCKVNQFESASFQTAFEEAGCTIVPESESADIVVVNTCAVTAKAGAQSRQVVRRLMRKNPQAKMVVTGCYAQMAAQELVEIVDNRVCIVGNGNKHLLVQAALCETPCDMTMLMGQISKKKEICRLPVRRFANRTRAYLRVQDGCSSYCTYCIVPYTRGPSRSLPFEEVLEQATTFAKEGHREIVVTGIHVGMYGKDLGEGVDIVNLLDRLSRELPETRFRLSSIEPLEITDSLLTLIRERHNLMPHLHIPLQSGDDQILSAMNRRYSRDAFREVIKRCREMLPEAAIGIDVLCGFPGESETHFANGKALLEELDFSYLHVFPYSIRPGTIAATMDDQVSKSVREERVIMLRRLSEAKSLAFYQRFLGDARPLLVERMRTPEGLLRGFTDNYIPVCFEGDDSLINQVVTVEIETIQNQQVLGKRI